MLERNEIKKLLICFREFNKGFEEPLVKKFFSITEAITIIIEITLKLVNKIIDKIANCVANEIFSL